MEQRVAEYLGARGFQIIERNYESAGAEVDIVAREPGGAIVFVEVRSRASGEHGSPLETVGWDKQRRVVRAATAWLVKHELWERVEVRFDVVSVTGDEEPQWVRGAFEV